MSIDEYEELSFVTQIFEQVGSLGENWDENPLSINIFRITNSFTVFLKLFSFRRGIQFNLRFRISRILKVNASLHVLKLMKRIRSMDYYLYNK